VGAPKLKDLVKYLPSAADGGLDIKIVNDEIHKPDSLNYSVRLLSYMAFHAVPTR